MCIWQLDETIRMTTSRTVTQKPSSCLFQLKTFVHLKRSFAWCSHECLMWEMWVNLVQRAKEEQRIVVKKTFLFVHMHSNWANALSQRCMTAQKEAKKEEKAQRVCSTSPPFTHVHTSTHQNRPPSAQASKWHMGRWFIILWSSWHIQRMRWHSNKQWHFALSLCDYYVEPVKLWLHCVSTMRTVCEQREERVKNSHQIVPLLFFSSFEKWRWSAT